MITFLEAEPAAAELLTGEHNALLVALSYLVAWLAALAALVLLERVRNAGTARRRKTWLAIGAAILGIGIWSLHFIGMLAFELPVAVAWRVDLTLVSILPAIVGSAVVLQILSREHGGHWQATLGGTFFGLGVGAMHYIGMAAMEAALQVAYDPFMFTASVLVAIGLGIIAVYAYLLGQAQPGSLSARNLAVAAIIALAISGMHYTAMHAATFTSAGDLWDSATADDRWLAYGVGAGAVLVMIGTFTAVLLDRRLESEALYRDMSREQLLEIIDAIRDGIVLMDEQNRILLSNRALSDITGYGQPELLGQPVYMIQYADNPEAVLEEAETALEEHGSWQGELDGRRKDGSMLPIRVSASRVRYSRSSVSHYIATVADISEQRAAAARIRHLAFHDPLTDLPNRRLLNEQLEQLRDQHQAPWALLLVDVDNFKALNDSLGHANGDLLLQQIARRLHQLPSATGLARLGGNEFAVITKASTTDTEFARQQLAQVLDALRASLEADYDLQGSQYSCQFSIGVASSDEAGREPDQLVTAAGLALQQAKRAGGACDRWFSPELAAAFAERLALEKELRNAIASRAIELHFQPQLEAGGRIIGAEALARWEHPDRGQVSPAEFISLAEETGLIIPLGSLLMEQACRHLAAWQNVPELAELHLSVNVSVRQFQHPFFAEELLALLDRHQVPRGKLIIEITESLLMQDVETTLRTMNRLKAEGLGFSLDDFGTGYSSLAYLKQLPFDSLKIDLSFVKDLPDDSNSAAIVRTIISLAEVLQLQVVAEGVEREAQLAFLMAHGCSNFQGFLFSRPQSADRFVDFVHQHGSADAGGPV